MKEVVIGIDLGTQNTVTAFYGEHANAKIIPNAEGKQSTPSVVAFPDDKEPIVGDAAVNSRFVMPTISNSKRELDSDNVLLTTKSGDAVTAIDAISCIIAKAKKDAEDFLSCNVNRAHFTVPVHFTDRHKAVVKDAAQKAGLAVDGFTTEPVAAAIAYGLEKSCNQTFVVFDCGGGTTDTSVLESDGETIATKGTKGETKAGEDLKDAVKKYSLEQFTKKTGITPDPEKHPEFFIDLDDRAEQAKQNLSVAKETSITLAYEGTYETIAITREQFEKLVDPLITKMVRTADELIKELGLTWKDIDQILLVGGSSKVPRIQDAIESLTGHAAAKDIDAMHCVAIGAAIIAATRNADSDGKLLINGKAIPAPKVTFTNVVSHSLGCIVSNPQRGDVCAVIIPKHTPIPCECEDVFRFVFPDQVGACVQIVQGEEGVIADDCQSIGEVSLTDLPIDTSLPMRIKVTYAINEKDAMATAYIEDLISDRKADIQFDYSHSSKNRAA